MTIEKTIKDRLYALVASYETSKSPLVSSCPERVSSRINKLRQRIQILESHQSFTMIKVDSTLADTMYFFNMQDFADNYTGEFGFDGLKLEVEWVSMTGVEIGQLDEKLVVF